MDWTQSIDNYCERTDPSFWSEPLNATSNLAFFVAAVLVFRAARTAPGKMSWQADIFGALILLVGVGSFLFHTFAKVWAGFLDVLFILAFIYVFFAYFLARVAALRWPGIALGLAGYWLGSKVLTAQFPPGSFNGSYDYLPPLAALFGLAAFAYWKKHPGLRRLALAAVVFAVSLALRTVDQAACEAWPWGTHFVWHCLNAAVLYLTTTALLDVTTRTAN